MSSRLDANQVLPLVLDESTQRLRVDAKVSASVSDVDVVIDAVAGDNIAITDPDNGNTLNVEADGSLNANVVIDRNDQITVFTGDEAKKIDDTSTNKITYVGAAVVGANGASSVWKIFRINETSGFSIEYADGNSNYDNIWNNRTSLTYT